MAEIFGDDDSETLNGTNEDDRIRSGNGNDTVDGKAGDDWINAWYDEKGNDQYHLYDGTLIAYGGPGNDLIGGKRGNDELYGGAGNERIYAWQGDDRVYGGKGDDELYGADGDDTLTGGEGDDELYGGDGDDTLTGGEGIDRLHGGYGNDTYYIRDLSDYIYPWDPGDDTAIVSVSFAKIPANVENIRYVNGALPLPYWIDALLPGNANGSNFLHLLGEDKIFRYIFPSRIPDYDGDPDHATGYRQLSATQQRNAVTVLEYLEEIIDIEAQQTNDANQPNTIAIARNQQENTAGFARYPNSESAGSDIFLNDASYNATLAPGTSGAGTLIHELGHALGLKHPFDDPDPFDNVADPPYLDGEEDHPRWTVMSYTARAERGHTFSELDIAALHYLYGPSKTSRAGDDRYVYDPDSANFIWDGAGNDTIDASGSDQRVTIFLEPGHHGFGGSSRNTRITAAGQITVNFGSEIENLLGSDYDDELTGNQLANAISGRNGADRIFGKDGNDSLDGGAGDDLLDGGDGNDSLDGKAGADRLFGKNGDDSLDGGSGNDRLTGGAGSDTLNGGPGLDYGIFSGNRNTWSVSADGNQVITVTPNSGTAIDEDKLTNVERLEFADVNIAFDINGNAGIAAKVLGAFLGAAGLARTDLAGRVLGMLDAGMSFDELLQTALDAIFGSNPGSQSVVGHFYRALTGRQAPDDVLADWGGRIDRGELSTLELSKLVAEYELNLSNIDLVGLESTGVEYLVA